MKRLVTLLVFVVGCNSTPVEVPLPKPPAGPIVDANPALARFRVIYAYPNDVEPRSEAFVADTMFGGLLAANAWLASQTGSQLKILIGFNMVQIPLSESQISQDVFNILRTALEPLLGQDQLALVWYDGTSDTGFCGGSAWPPEVPGRLGILHLKQCPGVTQRFYNRAAIHEMLHVLGIVPRSAPLHANNGHVSGPSTDLMFFGPRWDPKQVDLGGRNYLAELVQSPYTELVR